MPRNTQILLASRPQGEATVDNFQLVVTETPPLQEGQVLVRHHYLSLDPYMRGRMNAGKSYAPPQPLGEVMIGATVGEVVESRHPDYAVGDQVVGMGGWQEYSVVDARQPGVLRKVDMREGACRTLGVDSENAPRRGQFLPDSPPHSGAMGQEDGKKWAAAAHSQPTIPKSDRLLMPLSYYLGAVGMPGVTAWYGLVKIIAPKAGDTLVVSAATGAVGSAFAALAKARGCRVVGIAGGSEKCRYALDALGFDACIDYKLHQGDTQSLARALQQDCPQGIDGYFENVGGWIMDAVMLQMNAFSRMAVCGMIAGYDGQPLPMRYPALILTQRMRLEGFIVSEHTDVWPQALQELTELVASGKLRPRETIAQGIAAAPEAFLGMLKGKNLGKQLVKLV
ncbi:MAG: NADP-dependent oxidoreductase [Pseudomonadota bacterium]